MENVTFGRALALTRKETSWARLSKADRVELAFRLGELAAALHLAKQDTFDLLVRLQDATGYMAETHARLQELTQQHPSRNLPPQRPFMQHSFDKALRLSQAPSSWGDLPEARRCQFAFNMGALAGGLRIDTWEAVQEVEANPVLLGQVHGRLRRLAECHGYMVHDGEK